MADLRRVGMARKMRENWLETEVSDAWFVRYELPTANRRYRKMPGFIGLPKRHPDSVASNAPERPRIRGPRVGIKPCESSLPIESND